MSLFMASINLRLWRELAGYRGEGAGRLYIRDPKINARLIRVLFLHYGDLMYQAMGIGRPINRKFFAQRKIAVLCRFVSLALVHSAAARNGRRRKDL